MPDAKKEEEDEDAETTMDSVFKWTSGAMVKSEYKWSVDGFLALYYVLRGL